MFSRSRKDKSESPLIASIRESTIGHRTRIDGTHYPVPLLHADSTASGTTLLGLEEMLVLGVMPTYANTHSEASWTAQQTTRFREDARAWIKQSVGAGPGTSLIFCGSGTTAAVDKLIGMIGLRIPSQLDQRYGFDSLIPAAQRPVVFVGPYEHHSNDLPWRASIADVILIPEDARGNIDAAELERQLVRFADRPLRIGSFSAASNVTGIISDMAALTALLKAHGAYACWDCAAAAPHLPVSLGDADALFISPHKLPGGAGTPGVLIVRDAFVRRADLASVRPAVPGGGTVDFVGPDVVDYTTSLEHREEGGTPAIIESIRAGLAFRLRDAVGAHNIQRREWQFVQRALAAWRQVPQIQILRDTGADRVSTVGFTLGYTRGQLVHHNFVVALLNDLFGIQARSGCSCTGPYGHLLFEYTKAQSEAIRHPILQGYEGIKPGWVRISFNYLHSDEEVDYIISAVRLIATMGHNLLPDYQFNPEAGSWVCAASPRRPLGLEDLWTRFGAQTRLPAGAKLKAKLAQAYMKPPLRSYLEKAERVMQRAAERREKPFYPPGRVPNVTDEFNEQRWFPLPVRSMDTTPATVAKASSAAKRKSLIKLPTPSVSREERAKQYKVLAHSLSMSSLLTYDTPDLAGMSAVTLSPPEPTTPALSPTIEPDEDDLIVTPQTPGTPALFAPLMPPMPADSVKGGSVKGDSVKGFDRGADRPEPEQKQRKEHQERPEKPVRQERPAFIPLVVNAPIEYSKPKPKAPERPPLRFVPLVVNTPIVYS